MKLFQQLLVAPAALGLLASGANAAELNINGVSDYAASADQVTSVTQFSDVYPTDWAYQALANLVETYGCVAGYPNGTFRGNRAMTRYEAAALLNACLDRVTEVTDELRRLLKEFETELAILKGRVDGLEARVGELEATQFSTTTKLKGKADWVFGAATAWDKGSKAFKSNSGGTSFSYNLALNLETSFTGKDLLYTRLRSGNVANVYGDLFSQEYAIDTGDTVNVNRLYYSFPIGDFTVVGGPVVRMDDMLPVWPSAYPAAMTYDFFTYAGAPGAYNLAMGGGAGIYWTSDDFSISTSYLSTNANDSNPNTGGFMTDGAGSSATTQIAYAPENWGIAAAYTYASGENGPGLYVGNATAGAAAASASSNTDSFGVSAWWMPEDSGIIPSISAGYGGTWAEYLNDDVYTNSWYVGLEWSDAFIEGNSLGVAVGQPTWIAESDDGDLNEEAGFAWELFYKFQVTDNISVTPAITYLSKPYPEQGSNGMEAFSGLIKTQFKF
ncbi:outer membrane porin [Synechococcus sp. RS9907]|uniref:iron uptake porin n=1 Tax=Synechococcus sp. RS9907 TaxID=221350 RepID=UPI00165DE73B|nr:iron uptake porin [Synechococcus sp. RS9907]QNI83529.1 outer membrane porin [Synechococcus sp. RS9907]